MFFVVLLLYYLLHQGKVALAGSGTLILVFLGVILVEIINGTVRVPATMAYLFVIITAGMLFEWRGTLLSVSICSLAVLGMILAENTGMLPQPVHFVTLINWITYTGLFGVIGAVSLWGQRATQQALGRAEQENKARQRVELELRKLTQAVEQSPASVMITDLSGNIEYVNPRFTQITGYSFEEALGKNPRILKTDLTAPDMHNQLWQTITHGKEWHGEFVNRKKDGTLYYESATISAITNLHGSATHYLAIKEDITERKQVEEALRESEERFRLMFENHQAVMLLIEPATGQILDANQSAAEFYGYARTTLTSLLITEINVLTPDEVKKDMQKAEQGLLNYFIFPHQLKSGDIRIVEVYSSPLKLHERTALFSIMHDITERKRIDEALEKTNMELKLALTERDNLVNDLHGYQIDLEFNNGELLRMQAELKSVRDRYVDLYDLAPIGYCTVNEKGIILETNLTAVALLGVTRSQLINLPLNRFIIKDHQDNFYLAQRKLIRTRNSQAIDLQMLKKGGSMFWAHLQITFEQLYDAAPEIRVMMVDITERKLIEEALRVNEVRFRSLFEQTHDAVFLLDLDGKYLSANQRAADMFGTSMEELRDDVLKGATILRQYLTRMLAGEEIPAYEILFQKKDGQLLPVEMTLELVRDANEKPMHIQALVRDISARKLAEDQLKAANELLQLRVSDVEALQQEQREQAIHDPLTGLYNRRYLNESIEREIVRARREHDVFSIIISDIDHFKMINDTFGHPVGDKFLVAIASLQEKHTRGSDIACRYGGEEFLLVLPGIGLDSAVKRAEEIRHRCTELIIQHAGQALSVTMSFGVACFTDQGQAADEIIINADNAMYQSKRTGRNKVTAWAKEDSSETLNM